MIRFGSSSKLVPQPVELRKIENIIKTIERRANMGEFLEKYGGVIVTVVAISALIILVKLIFTSNTTSGLGKIINDKIQSLATLGS